MEDSKTEIKTKFSFSVESLLSNKSSRHEIVKYEDKYDEDIDDSRLDTSSERLDDEDDENITVDDDDTDGRESLSPNSSHTVIIPQPLHPSIPRMLPGHPQWPFQWIGPNGFRSSSPQSKYYTYYIGIYLLLKI